MASEAAILRVFDALQQMRAKRETGGALDGSAYFRRLSNAKEYAMRNPELRQESLATQFDRVRDYDATRASSAA